MLIVYAALLKPHHNAGGMLFQHPGGKARDHICLMHRRGDALQGGILYHRIAGVAAGAHHQVRRELPQNCLGPAAQSQKLHSAFGVMAQAVQVHRPLKAAHLDAPVVIARLGHQAALNAVRGTHKQNLHRGVLLAHIAGQSQGRIYMARRAAAGKNHFHSCPPLIRPGVPESAGIH